MTTPRRSLSFSFMERYAGLVIGMVMTAAGARLFTPADFPAYSPMSVIMLIDVLRDFGAGNYLVQLETLKRDAVPGLHRLLRHFRSCAVALCS